MKMIHKYSFWLLLLLAGLFNACKDAQPEFSGNPLEVKPADTAKPQINGLTISNGGSVLYGTKSTLAGTVTDNENLSEIVINVIDPAANLIFSEKKELSTTTSSLSMDMTFPLQANVPLGDGKLQISAKDKSGNYLESEKPLSFVYPEFETMFLFVGDQKVALTKDATNKNIWVLEELEFAANASFILSSKEDLSGIIWGANYVDGALSGTKIFTDTVGISRVALNNNTKNVYKITFNAYTFAVTIKRAGFPTTLYLVGGSTDAGWDNTLALPFDLVSEGVFRIVAKLKTDGFGYKFLPTLGSWEGDWGMKKGEPGTLIQDEEENLPAADKEGLYVITVDFTTLKYKVETYNPYPSGLYLVGGSTNAGWDNTLALSFDKVSNGVFRLITDLKTDGGGFKFLPTLGSWDGDWGMKKGEAGTLIQTDEDNVPAPAEAGKYVITVDFTTLKYSVEKFATLTAPENLFLLGGSTDADWNNANALAFTKLADGKFEIYAYIKTEGFGFKFIPTLGSWDGDYGMKKGSPGTIAQDDEDNLPAATEAGLYKINVDFEKGSYSVYRIENIYVVGAATSIGWTPENALKMTFDAPSRTFKLTTALTPGGFKFIKQQNWNGEFDWAGDGEGNLKYGGDINFNGEAGNYLIVVDFPKWKYTITKQ
jgi:hypothetical protein